MAPRNKPIPTFDTDPDQLFRLWQEAGRIPPKYNSWEELKADFMSRVADGKSAPQARKEMGVDYKNIIGNPILNIEKNKETGAVEFAEGGMRRAIREDFNIAEENEIRRIHGQEEVNRFRAELQNDWNNLSEGERVTIQRQFHKQFHRGHVAGAKTGGSIARENMWPEHGMRNSLHGALPRWPVEVMGQLGVPKNWIEAYYEKVLDSEGMPAAPRISDELAMAADERMVTPVSGMPSNIKGQTRWASDIPTDVRKKKWQPDLTGEAGIDPATLEMRAWKQKDAMAQVGEEAVRAQQANLSATMSRGSAVAQSGPMRIVQEGTTVVPYKTPKLGKALGKAGKLGAVAAIGQALLSGNPAEAIPVAAETFTPLGDLQGAPEPTIAMVNVGGKLRPLNTDTNTLMDKPGYGLEQKGGQWREVQRGTGAATKQQRQAIQQTVQQVTNLMPKVNKVVNPVGARITNEAQYFIVNPIKSAFSKVFGNRDI
jgi:hypothetical protein